MRGEPVVIPPVGRLPLSEMQAVNPDPLQLEDEEPWSVVNVDMLDDRPGPGCWWFVLGCVVWVVSLVTVVAVILWWVR